MIGHIRKQFLIIADRRIGVIAMVTQPENAVTCRPHEQLPGRDLQRAIQRLVLSSREQPREPGDRPGGDPLKLPSERQRGGDRDPRLGIQPGEPAHPGA
jgi:hypothetical protein